MDVAVVCVGPGDVEFDRLSSAAGNRLAVRPAVEADRVRHSVCVAPSDQATRGDRGRIGAERVVGDRRGRAAARSVARDGRGTARGGSRRATTTTAATKSCKRQDRDSYHRNTYSHSNLL